MYQVDTGEGKRGKANLWNGGSSIQLNYDLFFGVTEEQLLQTHPHNEGRIVSLQCCQVTASR